MKRPDTPLFKHQQNRANSWKLSSELIDSISQILEQKASGQIKFETNQSRLFDKNRNQISQKMYDGPAGAIEQKLTVLNLALHFLNISDGLFAHRQFFGDPIIAFASL